MEGLRIYGSPWQPVMQCIPHFPATPTSHETHLLLTPSPPFAVFVNQFFCNWAFNVERGEAIQKYWDDIPAVRRDCWLCVWLYTYACTTIHH